MGCSRRDFLKKMFYISISTALPINPFKAYSLTIDDINPAAFLSLINFDDCMKCEVDGTCKIIFPKIKFWSPVGFIEAANRFDVGASSKKLGFMRLLTKPITEILDETVGSFMPRSSFTIGELRGNETYMKVYPHFIGFPSVVGDAIKGIAGTIETGDVACVCSITGKITKKLIPGGEFIEKFEELEDMEGVDSDSLSNIYDNYKASLDIVPFFLSEFIMSVWDDEKLSIDRFTLAPFLEALHKKIATADIKIGKLACPYLTHYLPKLGVPKPKGVDWDFLCVGHWGYGYPRTGIVRHDDPVIAGLLAIARFHHLFSRTIKILKKIKYGSKIKYQLYNPIKSDCFKPGYYSLDPLARKLMEMSSPDKITELVSDPKKLKEAITDWDMPDKFKLPKENDRFAGVVVWYKDKKCCV